MALKPRLRLLDDELIDRILGEARDVLARLGTQVQNPRVLALLGDHGARVDAAAGHAWFPAELIDRCLASAPRAVAPWAAAVSLPLITNSRKSWPSM